MSKRRDRSVFENWGPEKSPDAKTTGQEKTLVENGSDKNHFATRLRANDFTRIMRSLPDPDPILRRMGRGITELKELLTDSHLESVWSVRCSTASGAEWFCAAGDEGRREKEAAELFAAQLSDIDIPRVIEEMMEAVAFGYAPLEVIWLPDGNYWRIGDIAGKPPEWFEFNSENALVFKTGAARTEELPPNRFLIARHRPSYANPYGVKVFSKCYWPATFKKNGFRWWTVFVEKYGGAFLYGQYPSNASEQYKNELLESLEAMIADAVAIAPEGAEIKIEALANKGSVNSVHKEFIDAANAEISKAVLGQTLTTEIGDKGSYAAAQAHNLVRGIWPPPTGAGSANVLTGFLKCGPCTISARRSRLPGLSLSRTRTCRNPAPSGIKNCTPSAGGQRRVTSRGNTKFPKRILIYSTTAARKANRTRRSPQQAIQGAGAAAIPKQTFSKNCMPLFLLPGPKGYGKKTAA